MSRYWELADGPLPDHTEGQRELARAYAAEDRRLSGERSVCNPDPAKEGNGVGCYLECPGPGSCPLAGSEREA